MQPNQQARMPQNPQGMHMMPPNMFMPMMQQPGQFMMPQPGQMMMPPNPQMMQMMQQPGMANMPQNAQMEEYQKQMMAFFTQMQHMQHQIMQQAQQQPKIQPTASTPAAPQPKSKSPEQSQTQQPIKQVIQKQPTPQQIPKVIPKKNGEQVQPQVSKVKQAMSSFMFFSLETRKRITESHPGVSLTDGQKIIGEKWRNMTEQEKKPYVDMAKESQRQYQIAIQNEMAQNGGKRLLSSRQLKAQAIKTKKNETKKERTPYINFSIEKMKELAKDIPMVQKSKLIGQMWHALSVEQKEQYKSKPIATEDTQTLDTTQSHSPAVGGQNNESYQNEEQDEEQGSNDDELNLTVTLDAGENGMKQGEASYDVEKTVTYPSLGNEQYQE